MSSKEWIDYAFVASQKLPKKSNVTFPVTFLVSSTTFPNWKQTSSIRLTWWVNTTLYIRNYTYTQRKLLSRSGWLVLYRVVASIHSRRARSKSNTVSMYINYKRRSFLPGNKETVYIFLLDLMTSSQVLGPTSWILSQFLHLWRESPFVASELEMEEGEVGSSVVCLFLYFSRTDSLIIREESSNTICMLQVLSKHSKGSDRFLYNHRTDLDFAGRISVGPVRLYLLVIPANGIWCTGGFDSDASATLSVQTSRLDGNTYI